MAQMGLLEAVQLKLVAELQAAESGTPWPGTEMRVPLSCPSLFYAIVKGIGTVSQLVSGNPTPNRETHRSRRFVSF